MWQSPGQGGCKSWSSLNCGTTVVLLRWRLWMAAGRNSIGKVYATISHAAAAREINYVAQKFSRLQIKAGSVFRFGRSLTGSRNCRTIEHRCIAKVYYRLYIHLYLPRRQQHINWKTKQENNYKHSKNAELIQTKVRHKHIY